ncbi:phage virion morphogenesis protein [Weeksella virosa]|uniref:phage virion morphogenesis protein n=1 Tax=Weeksella virosa TaxID=1014 RepID=UPI0025522510|nr:phage virion morphogenesis protein [Weeksella virosa]MDK7376141.1 phage virion morphogenesis protein [Weeksella virosa]MDK7674377.1 phage virion morphogenesis protein [Weeksella virosa]
MESEREFDENFERKAFFDQAWPETKWQNRNGSLMMRTGQLRGSINSTIQGDGIVFTSSEAYASIHNEGGKIPVTATMKKFFWRQYYENRTSNTQSTAWNAHAAEQASIWKAMALKPVGSIINMPKRQFIGDHPQVDELIIDAVDNIMQEVEEDITNLFNQ